MGMHLSARLAWHDDGWNGHICRDPRNNTYCSGRYSYPGDQIARARREDDWEANFASRSCSELDRMPPCMYSINAFGSKELKASADPPDFSDYIAQKAEWSLPPSTVCIWPYEEMYTDAVKKPGGGYDNEKRLAGTKALFDQITPDRSLVFYYSNYSNPFSEEDNQRYVVTGMARVKRLGEWLFYPGADEETRAKYAGAFVWQRAITSHYPEQGLRLPYHLYMDRPEVLDNILFVPDNSGPETLIINNGTTLHWCLFDEGTCLIDLDTAAGPTINCLDFGSNKVTTVSRLPKNTRVNENGPSFSVLRDGRWILYVTVEREESDIDNFR